MSKMKDYLQFGNGHAFEENPQCYNHQCHWAPWAHHYQDDPNETIATLANMLGSSLEENARLCGLLTRVTPAKAALLFSFIELADKVCFMCRRHLKPFEDGEKTMSIGGAFASIKQLNQWRAENRLNIRAVDKD